MGETKSRPVLQLHASRHCNLACRHCYSESGPRQREKLPLAMMRGLFADAAAEGYRVLNLSGGEPLLDRDLPHQLAAARAEGLDVNLVTNGVLLSMNMLEQLAGRVNLIAVSIDGPPELHDRVRGPGQFERSAAALRRLSDAALPFAIIHTVRPHSLQYLPWLVDYARYLGAAVLQLHPIEAVGRAALPGAIESGADVATRLAMLAPLLQQRIAPQQLHIDVLPLCGLPSVARESVEQMPLANWVDPLVIEPDGTVSPFVFGFSRRLGLGSLQEAPLAALIQRYRGRGLGRLLAAVQDIREELETTHPWPWVNWFEALRQASSDARFQRSGAPDGLGISAAWGNAP